MIQTLNAYSTGERDEMNICKIDMQPLHTNVDVARQEGS